MKESLSSGNMFATLNAVGHQLVIRVDDVGMGGGEERSLLREIVAMGHAVNAAVVPIHATTVAEWLVPLSTANSGRISVHQHGWRHANHEAVGRKSEFGPARPLEQKVEEIAKGKALLEETFGPAFTSVFCPPWNRVSDELLDICHALGFAGISGFGQLSLPGSMRDISANIDVTKACRIGVSPHDGLLFATTEVIARSQPPRLMIHPNVLTNKETEELLAFLAQAIVFGTRGVPFASLM